MFSQAEGRFTIRRGPVRRTSCAG
ncbi:MAG: hypothetical protein U0837_04970 [Dehalococcoidia bacterium]